MASMKDSEMPKLSIIDSLRHKWKRSIPSNIVKASPVLNFREGVEIIVTYTPATDKMKFFSAFIREGLENDDTVFYVYPDEESETIRTKFKEHGIDVKKHEKDGSLRMMSLTEHFMANSELNKEKAVQVVLDFWNEAKRKGYNHVRHIEDVGDFSFVNGQWQKYVTNYWLNPIWDDLHVSEWVVSEESGVAYKPFILEITATNLEHMTETQVTEILRAFSRGYTAPERACVDLIEFMSSFSGSIGLDHERLIVRKLLLEFDPASNYEKIIDSLAKESMANVESIFIFTSSTSPIHSSLTEQPAIKFFLTSLSTSTPKSISENNVLLPAQNTPLILDAISKVLEAYDYMKGCFFFDILSELLTSMGPEKTFTFLRHAVDMLSSKKITSLFLLDTTAHMLK